MSRELNEQEKLERNKAVTRRILIAITIIFIFVMLVMPLVCVITSSLKEGI